MHDLLFPFISKASSIHHHHLLQQQMPSSRGDGYPLTTEAHNHSPEFPCSNYCSFTLGVCCWSIITIIKRTNQANPSDQFHHQGFDRLSGYRSREKFLQQISLRMACREASHAGSWYTDNGMENTPFFFTMCVIEPISCVFLCPSLPGLILLNETSVTRHVSWIRFSRLALS